MNCSIVNCQQEAGYFCSCQEFTPLCKDHVHYHVGDLHQPSNLYHCPNIDERRSLFSNVQKILKDIELQKVNKIKEAHLKLEKIQNDLKFIVDSMENDISNLQNLLKNIVINTKFSRFEKICYLFNSTYEETIQALKNDKLIGPQNYFSEISPNYTYIDNQLCKNLNNLEIAPKFSHLINYEESKNENVLKKNVIWLKLAENGEFVPYSLTDNEIIENAYQNNQARVYIGGSRNQCYVNLKSPKIEVQTNTKKAVTVIRNDGSLPLDINKNIDPSFEKQWYFKSDNAWEKIPLEASRIVEWAYQNNFESVLVQNRHSYKIDIKGLKQTNLLTSYKRDIKRDINREIESPKSCTINGSNTNRVNLKIDESIDITDIYHTLLPRIEYCFNKLNR